MNSRCVIRFSGAVLAGALLLGLAATAGAASLGDPAPALKVEKWVKGSAATPTRGTNVYVVEFWATWCPPCRTSIPFLTSLQKKYADKGLVVIGLSSEAVEDVAPFVEAQGEKMNYRVAVDSSRTSAQDWMAAYEQQGIPHAFVVSQTGQVVWHGFPNAELEKTVDEVLAGKYDLAKAQNSEKGERALNEYRALLADTNAAAKAAAVGERIVSEYSGDWRVPFLLARIILTDSEIAKPDTALALKAATKAVELTKKENYVALEILARAYFSNGKKKEAVETQKQAVSLCKNDEDLAILRNTLANYEKAAQSS